MDKVVRYNTPTRLLGGDLLVYIDKLVFLSGGGGGGCHGGFLLMVLHTGRVLQSFLLLGFEPFLVFATLLSFQIKIINR